MDDGVKVVANWSTLIEDFKTSTLDFYYAVEIATVKRQLPDVRFTRKNLSESHVFSSSREYLFIKRKTLTFAVCSAPYGGGQFFSWWLLQEESLLRRLLVAVPFVGRFFEVFFGRVTFYQADTTAMFKLSVQQAVREAIDEVTNQQGRRNPVPELVERTG